MITQDELKKLFHYDPETGLFTRPNGQLAGSRKESHSQIYIKGRVYLAHRLAWLYVYGEWPVSLIDHIDRNGMNNKLSNLRQATYSQNALNKPSSRKNALGVKGVYWAPYANKYRATGVLRGKHYYLGLFTDIESASAAYQEFARKNHGEFYQINDNKEVI
jgi:hypothetical protein